MKKYDKYSNDLTRYINQIIGYNISDLVGDIVGDILEADIPINIPNGDISIDVLTPLGIMNIKYVKEYYQETLYLTRKIGETIYEEFIIDLNQLIVENKVSGLILEERENGIILSEINREYEPIKQDGETLRLIKSSEIRRVYNRSQLYDIGLYLWCFPLDGQFDFVKEDYKKFKRLTPIVESRINMDIPEYIRRLHREGHFRENFNLDINSNVFDHLYTGIKEDKKLEIVNDLLHANITSMSVKSLKNMIIWSMSPKDYRNINIKGFSLFDYYNFFWSSSKESGTINGLTEQCIGPSEVQLGREYYEYLRDLIINTFQIDIPSSEMVKEDIVQLIKDNYQIK